MAKIPKYKSWYSKYQILMRTQKNRTPQTLLVNDIANLVNSLAISYQIIHIYPQYNYQTKKILCYNII